MILDSWQNDIAFKDFSKLIFYWIAAKSVKVLLGNTKLVNFSFITRTLHVLNKKKVPAYLSVYILTSTIELDYAEKILAYNNLANHVL